MRIIAFMSAIRTRSKSMSGGGLVRRASARFLAASARAMSISSGRSASSRQNRDAIGQHFGKAERNRHVVLLAALAVPQLADLQHRQHRRMARQHAEVAVGRRNLDLVDRIGHDRPIGRHDLEPQMRGKRRVCPCLLIATPSSWRSRPPGRSSPACRTPARAARRACLR